MVMSLQIYMFLNRCGDQFQFYAEILSRAVMMTSLPYKPSTVYRLKYFLSIAINPDVNWLVRVSEELLKPEIES